jgi:succinate-semialdehyde dehydrogenase/glutarate-semialdehyde dehydrogenase
MMSDVRQLSARDVVELQNATLLCERAFVDGVWLEAESRATFAVHDPADGSVVGRVPDLGVAEVNRAIAAAGRAFPEWSAETAKARADALRRWFQLIHENADDLAILLTRENGKPLAESRAEVTYAASFVEWFAEEGRRLYGDVIPPHRADNRIVVLKQPVGVVAAITPWNFPLAMITRKVAPALAAGCTTVVKPAEQTPLSALALARLAQRAGIPDGVLNIVTGLDAVAIGAALCGSPVVRKVTFTGSTEVGRILMRQCADSIKKLSLELGGNAPFIVFDDADLTAAIDGLIACKFRNAGQTCVCANRIYVQDGLYDAFAEALSERVERLAVGPGLAPGSEIGPLIDEAGLAKVKSHIADAVTKGAAVQAGGDRHRLGGTFFQPTVLSNLSPQARLSREETFGPVAPLYRFANEGDVIRLANDTEYGLAAYFYARDIGRVWRVAEALEYGMVGINTGVISNEVAPFGGVKQSGLGREGSKYGIEEFTEIKYLCLGGM